MTRAFFALYLALCFPRCLADCLQRGYGWRNGLPRMTPEQRAAFIQAQRGGRLHVVAE